MEPFDHISARIAENLSAELNREVFLENHGLVEGDHRDRGEDVVGVIGLESQ